MEREYVGIDYHRRRSVLVRRDEAGASLGVARVVNDSLVLAAELAKAGPEPDVVIEAAYGWYWVVDLLHEQGERATGPPVGHQMGQPAGQDYLRAATDLADLLRLGRRVEAWIAPPRCGNYGNWSATATSWSP